MIGCVKLEYLAVYGRASMDNTNTTNTTCPLSCDRQHLSYGVCLEVRGEIIRTVLCIQQLYTIIQFPGLGFVTLGAFHISEN